MINSLLEVLFLDSVCPLISSFLLVFQTEAPMIHILYAKMEEMVVQRMNRFIKPEVIIERVVQSCYLLTVMMLKPSWQMMS